MDIRTANTYDALVAMIDRMVPSEPRISEHTDDAVDVDLMVDGEVVTQLTLTPELNTWGDSPDCWLRGDAIQAIRAVDGGPELYAAIAARAQSL